MVLFSALLCIFGVGGVWADAGVTDYIYWKKADIDAWHQFFPLRALQEEQLTVQAAVSALDSIFNSSRSLDLASIVVFQAQEWQTADLLLSGTAAEGCVSGLQNYMSDAIRDAAGVATDCSADALSKIARLTKSLDQVRTSYLSAYKRATDGIDVCAKIYPNRAQLSRLQSCVESMNKSYFTAANQTQNSVFPSPSMKYISGTVLECASAAASAVVNKGWTFLSLLKECASMDPNIDQQAYNDELNSWAGFHDTLANQITKAQAKNYYQVYAVENEIQEYYTLQKQAMEKYMLESRGLEYYRQKAFAYLSSYYNTVTQTSLANPEDITCGAVASQALDAAANQSAWESLRCDTNIVNDTQNLIANVKNAFLLLNDKMPSLGNPTLLECLSRGFIFAPNTIFNCFNLEYLEFNVTFSEVNQAIAQDVATLRKYESSFFSGASLPCDDQSVEKLYLAGENALYGLQRCLYQLSGTTYDVTTPYSVVPSTPVLPTSAPTMGPYYTWAPAPAPTPTPKPAPW